MAKIKEIIITDPIYGKNFECLFINNNLTKEERDLLTNNTHSIRKNSISINVNKGEKGGIPILKILNKMKVFDIKLMIHDNDKNILGIYHFKECKFKDLFGDTINYDWDITDYSFGLTFDTIVKPTLKFTTKSINYIDIENYTDYKRTQKLKKILK